MCCMFNIGEKYYAIRFLCWKFRDKIFYIFEYSVGIYYTKNIVKACAILILLKKLNAIICIILIYLISVIFGVLQVGVHIFQQDDTP